MKKSFIVANWKSNKTVKEAEEWIKEMANGKTPLGFLRNRQMANGLEVILCPPFTLLYDLKLKIENLKLKIVLGAQDISPFPDGAYTGEISARMLKELGVEYVIIGHSERRKYFGESEQILENKVKEALDVNIIPIFCVQGKTTPVPERVKIIAYEPVFAIGTGNPDTPEDGNKIALSFKERLSQDTVVLYGGSVTPENVRSFCLQENIGGVLVGEASLNPKKFSEIVQNASKI